MNGVRQCRAFLGCSGDPTILTRSILPRVYSGARQEGSARDRLVLFPVLHAAHQVRQTLLSTSLTVKASFVSEEDTVWTSSPYICVPMLYTHTHTFSHVCPVTKLLCDSREVTYLLWVSFPSYKVRGCHTISVGLNESEFAMSFSLLYPYSILLGSHCFCNQRHSLMPSTSEEGLISRVPLRAGGQGEKEKVSQRNL